MRISDLIRNPPHQSAPPRLKRKKTRKRKTTKLPREKKKPKLFSTTFKNLSKAKLVQANTVFDAMAVSTPCLSIFLFMLVDLYLAFPTLKIFERIDWLHGIWSAGINSMAQGNTGALLQNKLIWSRCAALAKQSEHLMEDGIPLESGFSPRILHKEVTSMSCQIDTINLDTAPSMEKAVSFARQSVQRDKVEFTMIDSGGFNWEIAKLQGRAYVLPISAEETSVPTFWPTAKKFNKLFHTNHMESFTTSPSNKPTIIKLYFDRKKFGIGFKEALWMVNQLKHIKRKPALQFIKRYEETLIYSKQWQAAFCLLSAVKVSTFSTYLGALNTFFKFLSRPEQYETSQFSSLDSLIQAIKTNSLSEDDLIAYVLYRISRVKFSTLRGNLTAISFFYRHVANMDFWSNFKRLQNTIKSCSAQFDEDAEGSIYLSWNHMKIFLQHVFTYDFSDVDRQVFFDCLLLSFWFGFRISEASNIWFRSMCILPGLPGCPPRIRACIVDSKTNDEKTPWHMVTLTSFPEREWRYWCPVRALKRLQSRRKHNQDHIFTRKNGKPFTKNWLDTTFRKFKKDFQNKFPHIISDGDKCTFHVFRVSVMGFYIRELNLSIYETQSLIRHKLGSRTTEQIYLAKSLQEFNNTAANKILAYVSKHNHIPPEEKEFLINCNNKGLAKRFSVFQYDSTSTKPIPNNSDDEFFAFSGPRKK